MAQDKMGHALAFYNLLHELGEKSADELAFTRGPAEFRCCSLVVLSVYSEDHSTTSAGEGAGRYAGGTPGPHDNLANNPVRDRLMESGDWAVSLVRQFLYSEADAVRMKALESSTYEPLAHVARKIHGELKYHTLHARTLMPRLGNATEDSRARLQGALDYLWPHALGMFEATDHDEMLAEAAICPREEELCAAWKANVERIADEAGLRLPKNAKPVYGGRRGKHQAELKTLLDEMQHVYRLDPGAEW
jgi:ring-1,2-phenylacetyl-CoA epoxidase subunit PaaC